MDKDNVWTVASDAEGRDGVIYCNSGERIGDAFGTEQTYVFRENCRWLSSLVIKRIEEKSGKGKNYGKDRHLVIFIDKQGKLNWKRIMKAVKDNDIFNSIWLFGKKSKKKWTYFVMLIKTTTDPQGAFEVSIAYDFKSW